MIRYTVQWGKNMKIEWFGPLREGPRTFRNVMKNQISRAQNFPKNMNIERFGAPEGGPEPFGKLWISNDSGPLMGAHRIFRETFEKLWKSNQSGPPMGAPWTFQKKSEYWRICGTWGRAQHSSDMYEDRTIRGPWRGRPEHFKKLRKSNQSVPLMRALRIFRKLMKIERFGAPEGAPRTFEKVWKSIDSGPLSEA